MIPHRKISCSGVASPVPQRRAFPPLGLYRGSRFDTPSRLSRRLLVSPMVCWIGPFTRAIENEGAVFAARPHQRVLCG